MARRKASFINVDLELMSKHALLPIARELEDEIVVMHEKRTRGAHVLNLEVNWSSSRSADRTINRLCKLVESLGEKGRRAWEQSHSRVFNIGYESGLNSRYFESVVRPATVRRVARLGGAITVTVYAYQVNPVIIDASEKLPPN